ncbi:SRPBCC domain-containing protein [Nocardia sp. ET3-3]|uniref:SRPBCC domain-containing protein n=1 Tax=Nocardia terrae TaxID=2675851 RepID=A0A7K1V0S3_9NOCA|nr:SRPBCC domain-containing protein [Nocardia terrae]MVU80147.1 SRPBCC domain-containing protein [Nocardia terrae]
MNDQNFTVSVTIDRGPAEVFAAVLDPRGWWGADIEGDTEKAGDIFDYEVPGVHRCRIELTEVAPDRKVVWLVRENRMSFISDQTEWVNNEIHFDIAETDGGTELRFTQIGLVPANECYEACSPAWTYYVTQSLRDLATTGIGRPNQLPGQDAAIAAVQGTW